MSMRIHLVASVQLSQPGHRPVTAGYRPTLRICGAKALCIFDAIQPTPLSLGVLGTSNIRVLWESSSSEPFKEGVEFELLEGELVVGNGRVLSVAAIDKI